MPMILGGVAACGLLVALVVFSGGSDDGSPDGTADAIDAARQSMTLLRNSGGALPLEPGQRLLLLGPYADYGVAGNASSSGKKHCGDEWLQHPLRQ